MPRQRHTASDFDEFLQTVPDNLKAIVELLRQLIIDAAPETAETVLWGALSYHRPSVGGRVKGSVCQIEAKEDCVHLGFIHGAALPDPDRLLRGDRMSKRYVRLTTRGDVRQPAVRRLVEAAAVYRPGRAQE